MLTVCSPHDTKNFDIALLFLLKPKIRRRSINVVQNATSAPKTYKNGLSKTEEQLLRRHLFGPIPEAMDSPGMARLLKSTLELGYPQPGKPLFTISMLVKYERLTSILALDESMRRAKERGTDIDRCCLGLPIELRMPYACTRPEIFSSSSSSSHERSTTEVWNPNPDPELLEISSSSTIVVDEPIELLTKLAVDGVDPPGPFIPDKTMTSDGELPMPNSMEDIKAFVSRRPESPDRSRVLCEQSPSTEYGSAECETFKAYYHDPPINFLNYFHLLEQAPDPQIPTLSTKCLDWPHSPSTLGYARTAKQTWTDTNPVATPKREQVSLMIVGITEVAGHGGDWEFCFH